MRITIALSLALTTYKSIKKASGAKLFHFNCIHLRTTHQDFNMSSPQNQQNQQPESTPETAATTPCTCSACIARSAASDPYQDVGAHECWCAICLSRAAWEKGKEFVGRVRRLTIKQDPEPIDTDKKDGDSKPADESKKDK